MGVHENGRRVIDKTNRAPPFWCGRYGYGAFIRGTTNAVNALAAIEQEVFVKKRLSLSELLEKLEEDPTTQQRLLAAPRWGSDDERADHWAKMLSESRQNAIDLAAKEAGIPKIPVCHVVRSFHHLGGQNFGASADGRAANTPLCDSIGSDNGSGQSPTSAINSILKKGS